MPSAALADWRSSRALELQAVDGQCDATLTVIPPNPQLADANLRSYVMLLSAHFQGFCRDLYTDSAFTITSKVRPRLRALLQEQFTAHRKLDHGNPHIVNLEADFKRFGFEVERTIRSDAANGPRLTDLNILNKWRNAAVHQGAAPSGGILLTLPSLRAWRASCDGLAVSLDGIMYNQLRRILRSRGPP
jgi:hypothetical protein